MPHHVSFAGLIGFLALGTDGTYNPVVSGAASGIASIMFAIQDARYNASIETVEFRDCAVSLGYRRYILGQAKRGEFDASPDHGFASLVAAATPADGRPANAQPRDNYYDAALIARPYETRQRPWRSVRAFRRRNKLHPIRR